MALLPGHWSFRMPMRHTRRAADLLRQVNCGGPRHVATVRRLVAFGPWTIYVTRHRPGWNDDGWRE